jgi:hypothetical protein
MAFNFNVQEATREKIYPKVALMGPSGAGKTYSALRLATGMKKAYEKLTGEPWSIIFGNTEGSRGRYYANEFDYKIQDLEAPFSPELYVAFIEYVETMKNVILVLDSTSHEWEGKGGCLELHGQAGGRYQDWAKVTPRHDKFINKMSSCKIPLVATMRGKDQYNMTQDEKGKSKVEKIGVGAKQRDGFEYEFTVTFMLDQKTNMAEHFKDNTHIFDREGSVILSESYGEKVVAWANSSDKEPSAPTPKVEETPKKAEIVTSETVTESFDTLESIIKEIDAMAKQKSVDNREAVMTAIKAENGGKANYNAIKDVEVAKKVKTALEAV